MGIRDSVNGLTERVQEFNKVEFEVERGQKGLNAVNVRLAPKSVSYTHLDVYKRQPI